ncbi:helicase HerA domain-containing protein [Fructobacillus tropaeoli]|uniref:helicase HerA domain-containing protein n=1 Tax=Fructobacillus tropaeoli TaxID=709323 RepID=UPI001A296842|nr:DUF87 domain-containing protein [Fructobacillus tropaeoli]GIC69400.1 DUF87 domain-containing protein [Fructobacillus tropaeoli]
MVANEYDFQTILNTQPHGGIDIFSDYIKLSNGYAQFMYVHEVKSLELPNHWLSQLATLPNTIFMLSTSVEDKKSFNERLNRADSNLEDTSKGGLTDAFTDSGDEFARLAFNVNKADQKPMRVYIRLLVYAANKRALRQNVKDIKAKFTDFKFATLREFQFDEWRSMWTPASKQLELLTERQEGLSMSSADLGGAYWQDSSKQDDAYGTVIGTTSTGGTVIFNPYLRDGQNRTRPFMGFFGSAGYGKSTLQKMLVEDGFKRGHRMAIMDPSGEYAGITKYTDGISVKLNGEDGLINPFQIYKTVTDSTGENVDVVGSFNQHIEKLLAIYGFMSQNLTQEMLAEDRIALNSLITEFYIDRGMWTANPMRDTSQINIFIPDSEYPTLNQFIPFLRAKNRALNGRDAADNLFSAASLHRIIATFEVMASKHGTVFNGTTTFPDLSHEQFVRYDVSSLLTTKDIFNAMTYVALTIEQQNIINNGKRWRLRRQNENIPYDQVPHSVIVLDEAQNYVQMDNAYNLNYIVSLMEQMRKNYAGLMLAMPTIEDLGVTNTNTTDAKAKEYYKNIKKMMDLLQYRFFFHLPDSNLDTLDQILGNSITSSELKSITRLKARRTLLNIDGDLNIQVYVSPTESQLKRFQGGD